MEYLSVDRIENDTAVCERDDMSVVELALPAARHKGGECAES